MCSPNRCVYLTKMICRNIQEYYLCNHLDRYIITLSNMKYLESIGWTKSKAQKEISLLWEKRREIQVYTEIRNRKSQAKVKNTFPALDLD